jgi:hypothetical protein
MKSTNGEAMKLLTPSMYRLRVDQDAWLRSEAERQGHGNKALALRLMIDRAMREKQRRRKSAA